MTITTLFGTEEITSKPRTIKFRQIKAIYETLTVKEDIANYLKTGTRYTAPQQVYETFSFLMKETKEMFITLHLDGKNRIICMDLVSIGSLNQSIVHPREVFRVAITESAAAIILIHNHPSGNSEPSKEDLLITKQLAEAGKIIDIKVLDHIIIAGDSFTSFAQKGLI